MTLTCLLDMKVPGKQDFNNHIFFCNFEAIYLLKYVKAWLSGNLGKTYKQSYLRKNIPKYHTKLGKRTELGDLNSNHSTLKILKVDAT